MASRRWAFVLFLVVVLMAVGCSEDSTDAGDMLDADMKPEDSSHDLSEDLSDGSDSTSDTEDGVETDGAGDASDMTGDTAPDLDGIGDAPDGSDTSMDAAGDMDADQESDMTSIAEMCFSQINQSGAGGPMYDQYMPAVGTHCFGTNQQDIRDVGMVVFLGDSVTVGTPNLAHPLATDNSHFWRNKLAEELATTFNLDKGNFVNWGLWKAYDPVNGVGARKFSGDFRNCSKWGARTDDFLMGGNQVAECFPTVPVMEKTLVVFTMGGNDISNITQYGADTNDIPGAWMKAQETTQYLDDAVRWLKDPANFPNGSYVIFANPFEFTDGTGDVDSCPAAELAGFDDWQDPTELEAIVTFILEDYMRIATDHGVDLVWMLEHFCGHGFVATGTSADPTNRCYRGPNTPVWFDETCIHPNDGGHQAIYEMFSAVVSE